MRFDRRSQRSFSKTRSNHSRMVRMIGLLVVVLILIQMAARPESWRWLTDLTNQEQSAGAREELREIKPVQIHRPGTGPTLPGDEIYASVEDAATTNAADIPDAADRSHATASKPLAEAQSSDAAAPEAGSEQAAEQAPEKLPAAMLDGVSDDWFGLTRSEQPALSRVMDQMHSISSKSLAAVADRQATFDVLLAMPDYYRGRAVSVKGTLRRLQPAQLLKESTPVDVWEGYVIAADSQNTPYMILCPSIPENLPRGDNLQETVTVDGYFIRRIAYATRSGEAITALIAAPTIQWTPAVLPSPEAVRRDFAWGMLGYFGIGALVLLSGGAIYIWSDLRYRAGRLHQIAESRLDADQDQLSALSEMDRGDPHRIEIEEPADSTSLPS